MCVFNHPWQCNFETKYLRAKLTVSKCTCKTLCFQGKFKCVIDQAWGQVFFFEFVCSKKKFRLKQNKKERNESEKSRASKMNPLAHPGGQSEHMILFLLPRHRSSLIKSITSFFTLTSVLCINPLCYNAYFSKWHTTERNEAQKHIMLYWLSSPGYSNVR